jgi:ELWxxDGT repeat protein
MTYANGYLYFAGMDAASGDEVWRINGTNGNVERLDEIVPAPAVRRQCISLLLAESSISRPSRTKPIASCS